MARVLLYGGTFDPIHYGHLIPARSAREILHADQVLLIPAFLSPHKQDQIPAASPAQRLRMIQLAIEGQPDFALDPRELHRAPPPPPSYTIDTLTELQRERPNDSFTLLIGADQLPKLHTWHRIRDLFAQTPIAVLARSAGKGEGSTADALTTARQHLGTLADQLTLLPTPRIDISATHIRHRRAQNLPLSFLLPPPVAAYVESEKLYLPPACSSSPK